MKKLLSFALVLTLVLAFSVPAMATGNLYSVADGWYYDADEAGRITVADNKETYVYVVEAGVNTLGLQRDYTGKLQIMDFDALVDNSNIMDVLISTFAFYAKDYTYDSWVVLNTAYGKALDLAYELNDNAPAYASEWQAKIDAAINAVLDAIEGLKPIADTNSLWDTWLWAMTIDNTPYTYDTALAFALARVAGKAVVDDVSALYINDGVNGPWSNAAAEDWQDIIDAAEQAIFDTYDALELAANYDALMDAYIATFAYDQNLYTVNSWYSLWLAASTGHNLAWEIRNLSVAGEGQKNGGLWVNVSAAVWQDAIDAAEQAIWDAIAGLQTKADLLSNLSNAQVSAGLSLNGRVLTLTVEGNEFVLSTNANNMNQSGSIALTGGKTLVFDIAGNGSNIKVFEVR